MIKIHARSLDSFSKEEQKTALELILSTQCACRSYAQANPEYMYCGSEAEMHEKMEMFRQTLPTTIIIAEGAGYTILLEALLNTLTTIGEESLSAQLLETIRSAGSPTEG